VPVTDWTAFAGFSGVVLALLLLLSHASRGVVGGHGDSQPEPDAQPPEHPTTTGPRGAGDADAVTDDAASSSVDSDVGPACGGADRDEGRRRHDTDPRPRHGTAGVDASDALGVSSGDQSPERSPVEAAREPGAAPRPVGLEQLREESGPGGHTTAALLANVAVSQGLFGLLLVGGAWYTGVPAGALGLGPVDAGVLGAGLAVGAGLYAANAAGSVVGERFGLGGGEQLREALAPETPAGWVVLLGVVLPVVAGFEELLFRGVLVGALSVGFGVSPWLLAVGSSVAFALGHGAQGRAGVVVTGVLGFGLAAAFVVTGSLLAVVVAHYLVNALEFVVHEGLGIEWE
jgi:membrane protease YdiL (CAAX protease family)